MENETLTMEEMLRQSSQAAVFLKALSNEKSSDDFMSLTG